MDGKHPLLDAICACCGLLGTLSIRFRKLVKTNIKLNPKSDGYEKVNVD